MLANVIIKSEPLERGHDDRGISLFWSCCITYRVMPVLKSKKCRLWFWNAGVTKTIHPTAQTWQLVTFRYVQKHLWGRQFSSDTDIR